ncbi:hypothetical protein R1flu_023873 [Riccia fluitans]|uniref:Uncharacterized protein n=1 Tax=Riccia fluitans TaxID=41844 RepID=A0ABD1XW73_9MARC
MDGKAMDVIRSSKGSQYPLEILHIFDIEVDDVIGTASSWAELDALDSVLGMDLTLGWNSQPNASTDHCLLADEVTPAKPQSDKGKGGCSVFFSSNGKPKMEETPTPE